MPSGLLVVLESDPYATAAGVVTVIRGGSGADPRGKEGLAHLVEHLTFRAVAASAATPLPLASPDTPKADRATRRERLIRYAAAAINGLTSPDAITFFEFGSPTRLPWLLELEAARLADPLAGVDQQAVTAERKVIANESQLREDPRVGVWAASQLYPLIFPPDHPYARPLNGSPQSREHLTLADAQAYVASTFRPERMTLLVTAPIAATNIDAIVERLPRSLVGDPSHVVARPTEAEPAPSLEMTGGPVVNRTSPLLASQLWIAWTLPPGYGPQGAVEALLARWVQEDLSIDQLRQEDPHIRHVASSLVPGQRASALLVRVLLDKQADADHVTRVVSGRVSSMWTRERAEADVLGRLKATFRAELMLNEPPQVVRAVEQAQMAALEPRPVLRAVELSAVPLIASSDLAKFAYEQLGQQRRHAVLFTPAAATEPAPRDARAPSGPAESRAGDLFTQAAGWDPMEIPGVRSPVSNVSVNRLPNGLTVVVARRRAAAVTAWLGFHGGYADSDPPLVVALALHLRPDAVDAPRHTALSSRGAMRDASVETLEFQAGDLGPALALLFAKAAVTVQKWPSRAGLEQLVAAMRGIADATTEKADQAFWRALFGEHPLARAVSASDLEKVTRADVESWIARTYNVRNALLVVVGDVDAEEVALYATTLSATRNAPAWVDAVPAIQPPTLRPATGEHLTTVITPAPGALTEIRLGCLLPQMAASDRADYDILRSTVDERLGSALRFELGESYALNATYSWLRGGTSFFEVSTFVDANVLQESLAVIRRHWRRWADKGFDTGEVNVGRWVYAGQLSVGYFSGDMIAYHLFNDWNADPGSLGRDTFHPDPLAVTPARLTTLFATCKANAVLSLTGNEEAIRHALGASWSDAR